MFIALCIEILKLTPEQILNSDYVLLLSILKEQNYLALQRNKLIAGEDNNQEFEYKQVVDFDTNTLKRVEKVNFI